MQIMPVAYYRGVFTSKFGIPRQSGLTPELPGRIVFANEYRHAEAVRGLEAFDYLWLIWEFLRPYDSKRTKFERSANRPTGSSPCSSTPLTVRPPRLGGNQRVGVFASRSPFRPNPLGLSCVRLDRVDYDAPDGPVIHVLGADLMDMTPIFDIKPYVSYADAHPDARSGFVDSHEWQPLQVEIPDDVARLFTPAVLSGLRSALAQDPRPRYHSDPSRVYGMPFAGYDIKFRVDGTLLTVLRAGTGPSPTVL